MREALPEEASLTAAPGVVRKRRRDPALFALKVFFFFSPLLLLIGVVEFVLWRTGETWTIQRVIENQRRNPGALFMRGILDQGFYRYKFLQIEALRPKILVVGSSRVMEFRREMFGVRSNDFFNAGGMIQDLSDLHEFAEKLGPATTPEVMILGLDIWWFNGNKPLLNGFNNGIAREAGLDWQEHARAFRRFKSGKGRWPAFKAIRARNDNIGIEARAAGVGFRSDGSMQYNFESPKQSGWKFVDRENPPISERIRNNSAQFTSTPGVSPERIELLGKCLDILGSKNVLVIGFCPPFSTGAVTLLEGSPTQSNFWNETRAQLPRVFRDRHFPYTDASIPTEFSANDTVMMDSLHAAETFQLTLLERFVSEERVAKAFPGLGKAIGEALKSKATDPWYPDYQPFFSQAR